MQTYGTLDTTMCMLTSTVLEIQIYSLPHLHLQTTLPLAFCQAYNGQQ